MNTNSVKKPNRVCKRCVIGGLTILIFAIIGLFTVINWVLALF